MELWRWIFGRSLRRIILAVEEKVEYLMAAIDDLTTAVERLEAQAASNHTELTAILALLDAANPNNDPAITAITARVQAVVDGLTVDDTAAGAKTGV